MRNVCTKYNNNNQSIFKMEHVGILCFETIVFKEWLFYWLRGFSVKWYGIALYCDSEMLNFVAQWNTYASQHVKVNLLLAFVNQ